MTYSSGGPGYPGAHQPGAYAPTTQFAKVDDGPSKLPVYLLGVVAFLGLAAYVLSFTPVGDLGGAGSTAFELGVVSLLFAALFAVAGLLPKQANYAAVVMATTVVGFLLAIWSLIRTAADPSDEWGLIAIVVVAALQTVAAIAVLLLDAGVITPPAPRPKYDPYQQFGSGGYYGQPQGQPQYAQPGHQPHNAGPQSFGPPPSFPQYGGGYPGGGPSSGGYPPQQHHSGPPTPPTGFPTFAQPPSQGQNQGQPTEQQRLVPPTDAPTQQVILPKAPAEEEASEASSPAGPPPA